MTLTTAISGEQRGLKVKGQIYTTLKDLGGNKEQVKEDSHLTAPAFHFPSHNTDISEYYFKKNK